MVYNVVIYNAELIPLAYVPLVSIVWEEMYNGEGGLLQLVVQKNKSMLNLIKVGYYVGIELSDTLMHIESIQDTNDGLLWAFGHEAKYRLRHRLFKGTIESGKVEERLISAFNQAAYLPNVYAGDIQGLPKVWTGTMFYPDLFTLSNNWCGNVGYGFTFKYDRNRNVFNYVIYDGTERPDVAFSTNLGNLRNLNRTISKSQFKNVAYVSTPKDDNDNITVFEVGDTTALGDARYEVFIDGSNVKREKNDTDAVFNEKVKTYGLEQLWLLSGTDEIEFEIDASRYRKEFYLGDVVSCIIPEYMLQLQTRIEGVKITIENGEFNLKLKLGKPIMKGRKI